MLFHKKVYLFFITLIVLLDQASKWLVSGKIALYDAVTIIPGWIRLWHVSNRGAVWGILSDHPSIWISRVITLLAVLALVVVSGFFYKAARENRLELSAFTCIMGGALGNIIDRLRLGQVVDYIDVYHHSYHFPTFNVADSFISIGVCLLAIAIWRGSCTPS
jgi:signal peptidase II